MFELIDEFENYDIVKKKRRKRSKNDQFYFYLGKDDVFPNTLYSANESFIIIKYSDYNNVITDLEKYYRDKKAIHDQFILDINRSHLYINGNKTNNIVKITNYIDYSYVIEKSKLELICTQSIFAPIVEWLYSSIPEGFYIGEMGQNEKKSKIKIYINHNKVHLIKKLRFFIINDNGEAETYRYIKTFKTAI